MALALLAALTACATTDESGTRVGVTAGPTVGELTSRQQARAAGFYTPTRGPLPLEAALELPGTAEPIKAAVYIPECASPRAPADHVAYLQSLGMAVAIPLLGGDQCVMPGDRLGTVHNQIDLVAEELRAVPWIRSDALYLVGHGVGADVASTYTRSGTFKGLIGLAAACPFGVQNVTPMLTFRALDDPVLRNRGTRCTQFPNANTMHVEFSGSDHTLRLHAVGRDSEDNAARALMRNTIARFIDAEDARTTIAERDEADLRQLGATAAAPVRQAETEAEAEPEAAAVETATPPVAADDTTTMDAPAAAAATETPEPETSEPATPTAVEREAPAAVARTTAEPAAPRPGVLYLPTLQLPPGRY